MSPRFPVKPPEAAEVGWIGTRALELLPLFSLCQQPLTFHQLLLCSLVVQGKRLRCINLQAAMEGRHRLGQKLEALWPLGPIRLVRVPDSEVVPGHDPVLRQLFARVNFQGTSVGGDSDRQMFIARLSLHASTEFIVSDNLRQPLSRPRAAD
jgi:hypothetical protein